MQKNASIRNICELSQQYVLRASILCIVLLTSLLAGSPSRAALEICNGADEKITTAIGYQSGKNWASKGWWSLEVGECAIVIGGKLKNQFYYGFGDGHDGGKWVGKHRFCVTQSVFTIGSNERCPSGARSEDFFVIDTGKKASDFTLTLTDGSTSVGEPLTIDLTSALNSDPKFKSSIADICRRNCRGNSKSSWLESASVTLRDGATFSTGSLRIKIRNRHKWGGTTVWSATETLTARIRIHNVSCRVDVTSVRASGEIGKVILAVGNFFSGLFSGNSLARHIKPHNICN